METINFRPAETYLLTNNGKIDRSKLLKLITIDLILSKALTFFKERKQPTPRSSLYTYKIIKRGPQYFEYEPDSYQKPFLDIYSERAYKLQIKQFGKAINGKIGSTQTLKSEISKSQNLTGLVKSTWLNSFKLTNEGIQIGSQVNSIISKAEKTLKSKSSSDKEKTLALKRLGNNVILIDDYSFQDLKNIFKKQKTSLVDNSDLDDDLEDTDLSDLLIGTFVYDLITDNLDFGNSFDDSAFDSSFDSSFDSLGCSSSDSSGCSSCSSGCSSCSS